MNAKCSLKPVVDRLESREVLSALAPHAAAVANQYSYFNPIQQKPPDIRSPLLFNPGPMSPIVPRFVLRGNPLPVSPTGPDTWTPFFVQRGHPAPVTPVNPGTWVPFAKR